MILSFTMISTLLYEVPFIDLAIGVMFIKYSFTVLKHTANGDLTAPDLSYEVLGRDVWPVIKQSLLLFLLLVILIFFFQRFGVIMGVTAILFMVLLLPAMIIVLAISDSLINALNPVSSVTVAYRIGWSYLLMYLFLILLGAAPAVLTEGVDSHLSSFLSETMRRFLSSIAGQYYTIVAYNLMGYVILQYHERLGYEVDADDYIEQGSALAVESTVPNGQNSSEALMNQVNILIKDGRFEEAIWLMQGKMQGKQPDLALSQHYYNLLKLTQRFDELLPHGVTHLDLLTAQNEKADVCEVYGECLSHDPQFTPSPEALFKIAAWLTEDNVKVGLQAYSKFIKANPQHALTPKAMFLLGKNLFERLNDRARAQQVLDSLLRRFPDHELAAHARTYIHHMSRVPAQPV